METIVTARKNSTLIGAAWAFMLLGSILPEILVREVAGQPGLPPWVTWGRLAALAALALFARAWPPLRPLWKYATILFVFAAAQELLTFLQATAAWQDALHRIPDPLARGLLGVQAWKLGVTAVVIAGLLLLGYHRAEFFLVRGQLDAPISPVRWLGFPRPESWISFGSKWTVFLALGTMALLFVFGTVHLNQLVVALGRMPLILFLSALNAFSEEVTYRSAQLGPLEPAIGTRHSLWIVAVLFGISHYYAAINGPAGAALTVFIGYMLTKAMLETRGFFWSWLIHFAQDVVIFWFIFGGSTRLN